jgi:hypothetical protein
LLASFRQNNLPVVIFEIIPHSRLFHSRLVSVTGLYFIHARSPSFALSDLTTLQTNAQKTLAQLKQSHSIKQVFHWPKAPKTIRTLKRNNSKVNGKVFIGRKPQNDLNNKNEAVQNGLVSNTTRVLDAHIVTPPTISYPFKRDID